MPFNNLQIHTHGTFSKTHIMTICFPSKYLPVLFICCVETGDPIIPICDNGVVPCTTEVVPTVVWRGDVWIWEETYTHIQWTKKCNVNVYDFKNGMAQTLRINKRLVGSLKKRKIQEYEYLIFHSFCLHAFHAQVQYFYVDLKKKRFCTGDQSTSGESMMDSNCAAWTK